MSWTASHQPAFFASAFSRCHSLSSQTFRCNHFHGCVVVRHAAGIEPPRWNQHVNLWPMGLQAAGFDAIDLYPTMELTGLIAKHD